MWVGSMADPVGYVPHDDCRSLCPPCALEEFGEDAVNGAENEDGFFILYALFAHDESDYERSCDTCFKIIPRGVRGMNKERILHLAGVIEHLQPVHERFNIDPAGAGQVKQGFSMKSLQYDCGSPACIAGWAIQLWGTTDFPLDERNAFELDEWDAGQMLGIEDHQVSVLFVPKTKNAHMTALPGEEGYISPRRAAGVLRNLVETGEVDWSVVNDDGTIQEPEEDEDEYYGE